MSRSRCNELEAMARTAGLELTKKSVSGRVQVIHCVLSEHDLLADDLEFLHALVNDRLTERGTTSALYWDTLGRCHDLSPT